MTGLLHKAGRYLFGYDAVESKIVWQKSSDAIRVVKCLRLCRENTICNGWYEHRWPLEALGRVHRENGDRIGMYGCCRREFVGPS